MKFLLSPRGMLGLLLILAGVVVLARVRIPFGRLPGDLSYRGKNFSFYLPLGTSLLLSILLSLIIYLLSRFRR